jgi:tripartite-type tricarboxylate transporter receptor subunit TctC
MNMRRHLTLVARSLWLAVMLAVTGNALAQTYPTRPVRIVVGTAAGGAQDVIARLIGGWLSELHGQPFVIENRPGGGTNIAAESVVRSQPDGHTLLLVGAPNAINATLYNNLSFNFIRDIAPIASIVRTPELMVVHPSVPARTIPEFIAYAKANPGKLAIASPGVGSGPHLSGELFKAIAAIDIVHVPYHGGAQALNDVIGGHVQLTFIAPVVAVDHIKTGKVHALAVTTATRSHLLPEVPSMAEFLPGYESSGWFGMGAPKDTPPAILDRLNIEINAALADPTIRARLLEMGGVVLGGSRADFAKLIGDETEKMGKVVKLSRAKPG